MGCVCVCVFCCFFVFVFFLSFFHLFLIRVCGEGRVIPGTWRLPQTTIVSPLVTCPQIMGRMIRENHGGFLVSGVGFWVFFLTILRTSLFFYSSKFCEAEDRVGGWGCLREIDSQRQKAYYCFLGTNLKKKEEEGIWWLLFTCCCVFLGKSYLYSGSESLILVWAFRYYW